MKKVFLMVFATFILSSILNITSANFCAQVIQPAINDSTKECKEFPTPCDVPDGWTKTDSCDTTIVDEEDKDDNQLIEKEALSKSKELKMNFEVKNFSSCQDLNNTIIDYLKNNPNIYYPMYRAMPLMMEKGVANDMVTTDAMVGGVAESSPAQEATDFSQTNIQFNEVDESDIVKNNGKYIYYYSLKDNRVYIIEAFPANNMKIVKKINLPKYFSNVNLFLSGNKLTITATRYSQGDYSMYYYNRNVKTTVIVYDVTNPNSLKLDRYYKVDGEASESRVIGDYLYILSRNSLDFPSLYYVKGVFDTAGFSKSLTTDKILPEKTDLSYTTDTKNQVTLKGKKYPYSLFAGDVSDCKNISVIMPDSETIKKSNFRPSLTTLSSINLKNSSEKVTTKLLFGDVSNILMSKSNLYITSSFYSNDTFRCGENMRCIMPYYYSGENTLIHKFNIDKSNLKYTASNMVSGSPLNQYSMDEGSDGTFRIITSSFYPERNTNLFILDDKMQKLSAINNIAPKEDFKSSRFMGDKLYLVTFEQIDPLFVIDLKDNKNPKILGELKIPGYSTYLHPLEEGFLLGLGFDTFKNKWGGTQNGGLKIDIYDVNDLKNPKQIHTLTLGDAGTNSESLTNPRMFVYDKSKKLLYLPITQYTKLDKNSDDYRYKDVFVGSKVIKVDIRSGIKELSAITHLDTAGLDKKRLEECKNYTTSKEQKCIKLFSGEEHCPGNNNYVPTYCYADSSIGEYLANQIWNFSDYFIKRNIYMDNIIYTLSDKKVLSNDISNSYKEVKSLDLK